VYQRNSRLIAVLAQASLPAEIRDRHRARDRTRANCSVPIVKATPQEFSLRKYNLVQANLAVNDLFYLSVPVVAS
jgi:hypothetical protein